MRKILALILLSLFAETGYAHIIQIGGLDLTGNFTLNHNFNFNNPAAAPFGTFSILTVDQVSGIFAPYVNVGDTLQMNTPFMFGDSTPISATPSQPMIWTIGGFTLNTNFLLITGADVGRFCFGGFPLSGNGFDPSAYPFGAFSNWSFTAPPYDISNFPIDITGPIDMKIFVGFDDHITPDSGATGVLLVISMIGVVVLRTAPSGRRMQRGA